jgi:vancomycin resistance protein VanW
VGLRNALRKAVPYGLRAFVAGRRRALRDLGLGGARPRFARRHGTDFAYPVVTVVQEIKPSEFLAGKVANLKLGAARLDGAVIAPGETLSFWRLVGKPVTSAGFAIGRSIRGGVVGGDVGGGLCQLSGIVYEAGIRAGLTPVERHPHSRDLYEEQERFTPLGLDATVVWPWKDLRLANPLGVPVRFRLAVRGLTLTAAIDAPEPVAATEIEIVREDRNHERRVRMFRVRPRGATELVSDDSYGAGPSVGADTLPSEDCARSLSPWS